MERNDFLLAATLLCVCLLVAAGFHSSVSNEQTAASWVQAVGTIGAVWAAIWVAGEERRRRPADWTGQSIMFADGLLAPMSQLAFECTRVRHALAMAQRPPDPRGPGPADVFANAQFIIPERLQYAMEINQFLAGRDATVVSDFVEVESAGKSDRPKLREALAVCQREKVALLIAKFDRLARSVAFIANLMDSNTEFVAVDMPYASRFVLHVFAAVAEHERQIIGERTKAALAAARARGVKLGANGAVLAERHKTEAAAFAREISHAVHAARLSGSRTTRENSNYMNAAGVPSRQGGRWYAASVARVLRRLERA